MNIPFNRPPVIAQSNAYIQQALAGRLSGDGAFTRKCSSWLEARFGVPRALLTTSCSHALDMAAHLCDLRPGDEIIMPSYTFSSTANAFVGCGAKIVFVDIRPDTMNMDEALIEAAVTDKTRVIAPMHYAGVACEMDTINDIAKRHNLLVVEDAAQGVMSTYKGKALGTLGDFGCYSFHETKNYSMGEGGALLIRDAKIVTQAEIIREKGTNRSRFVRGEIDKYSWVDWGSSYLPSELNAAYLWSQLEIADEINNTRLAFWQKYREMLTPLSDAGCIELPIIPQECAHNAHMFYIKTENHKVQYDLLQYLKSHGIGAVFHYVPLHSSEAGQKFGRFHGEDSFTTRESMRLVRLPLYYAVSESEIEQIAGKVFEFFRKKA